MTQELISAIICTRNRTDMIARAVGSVLANDDGNFDLTIIDQSDDEQATRSALGDLATDPRLRYVHTTKVGLSAAYNAAIAASSGPLLAFTDDDCSVPVDWLGSIRHEFEIEPTADLIYGQVLVPEELRDAPGYVPALPIAKRRLMSRKEGFEIYGMGANFAARRRLFKAIGGFDEMLGGGGPLRSSQDFDLEYRAYRANRVKLLAPAVWLFHYGLRTNEQWPSTAIAYGVGDGAFYMKHVRCGDFYAAQLFARKTVRESLKVARNWALRRPRSAEYARGLFTGGRRSLSYRVDRQHRMYVGA